MVDVSVNIAVCNAEATNLLSLENNLPSTETTVLPNLIIFAF